MNRLSLAFAGVLALAGALVFGSQSVLAQNCSGTSAANAVCAGPVSGGAGFPQYRALVGADMSLPAVTKTTNFSIGIADNGTNFYVDATSGSVAATLPTSPSAPVRVTVYKVDNSANFVTISGGQNIDGDAAKYLSAPFTGITLSWDITASLWRATSIAPAARNINNAANVITNFSNAFNVQNANNEIVGYRSQLQINGSGTQSGVGPVSPIDGDTLFLSNNTASYTDPNAFASVNGFAGSLAGGTGNITAISNFKASGFWNGTSVTTLKDFDAQGPTGTASKVTNWYGFSVTAPAAGVVSGNSYAFYNPTTLPTVTQGPIYLQGSSSGQTVVQVPAAAGSYNFNLPTTAGSSGQPLLSGGGGGSAMTFGTLGIGGGGTNCAAASGTCLDNITGFASTGFINRTGAGTYTFTGSTGSGSVVLASAASTTVAGQTCSLGSTCGLSSVSNSLSGDVALNNTATYFDGPSVAQGTSGTWFASGTVTLTDTAGAGTYACKLWDGTTVISSAETGVFGGASSFPTVALSGLLATPAANIRISCKDTASTSGKILFNQSGNSKDSTITAIRIN